MLLGSQKNKKKRHWVHVQRMNTYNYIRSLCFCFCSAFCCFVTAFYLFLCLLYYFLWVYAFCVFHFVVVAVVVVFCCFVYSLLYFFTTAHRFPLCMPWAIAYYTRLYFNKIIRKYETILLHGCGCGCGCVCGKIRKQKKEEKTDRKRRKTLTQIHITLGFKRIG